MLGARGERGAERHPTTARAATPASAVEKELDKIQAEKGEKRRIPSQQRAGPSAFPLAAGKLPVGGSFGENSYVTAAQWQFADLRFISRRTALYLGYPEKLPPIVDSCQQAPTGGNPNGPARDETTHGRGRDGQNPRSTQTLIATVRNSRGGGKGAAAPVRRVYNEMRHDHGRYP